MYYAMLAMAGLLTYFAFKNANILLRMACAIAWLALAFWSIYGSDTPFNMADGYSLMLVAVMVIMAFVPLLIHMDTEIMREYKGMRWAERRNKKSLDDMIRNDQPSVYEKHRSELRAKLKSQRRRYY